MRCTEVAVRPFPDGKFTCRDIGDRGRSPTELNTTTTKRMTPIFGTFNWTGPLPHDDDVERAPKPVFSGDYGEQWQYMATQPVIQHLCDALRRDETVTDLREPNPEDHGWYTYFKIDGWTWFLYVQWVPNGNREDCFEFDVSLCNNWWHRIFHRSEYGSRIQALDTAIANAFTTANQIDGIAFGRRAA